MNGAPNLSILDGWWQEGYGSANGWAIGEEREYKDTETQDEADALSLYSILEDEVVPEYYARRADWLERMRRAIASCGPQFSMRRMLAEYTKTLYAPAMNSSRAYRENQGETAHQVSQWKRQVRDAWPSVHVAVPELPPAHAKIGDAISFEAQVWPGKLPLDDLAVELVTLPNGGVEGSPQPAASCTFALQLRASSGQEQHGSEQFIADESVLFQGTFVPDETGKYSFGVRVRPHHAALIHPLEMGLSAWA